MDKIETLLNQYNLPNSFLRLYACECATWALTVNKITDEGTWNAIAVAKRYATGDATVEELKRARDAADAAAATATYSAVSQRAAYYAATNAYNTAYYAATYAVAAAAAAATYADAATAAATYAYYAAESHKDGPRVVIEILNRMINELPLFEQELIKK